MTTQQDDMAGRDSSYRTTPSLRPGQGLRFKFLLVLASLLAIAASSVWFTSRYLLQAPLAGEAERFQLESARGQAATIEQLLIGARDAALALGALADKPDAQQALITALTPQADNGAIVAIGLWPHPPRTDELAPRRSSYWIYRGSRFDPRGDYNDTRTVPYWREAWYTPARYSPAGHCYWTPAYRDPLLRREIVTCAVPILREGRFAGAATVSLDRRRLQQRALADIGNGHRYALLLDRESQVLATSPSLAAHIGNGAPVSSAELAKREPALAPLVLALHEQAAQGARSIVTSERYDAAAVSDLRGSTREMSRDQAESALLSLWSLSVPQAQEARRLQLGSDPVLREPVAAVIVPLRESGWWLVHVMGMQSGFAGMAYLSTRSLLAALAIASGLLLFGYWAADRLVLVRLRRLAHALDRGTQDGRSGRLLVEDFGGDEIGLLAHWSNERHNLIAELNEQIALGRSALQAETEQRRQAEQARIAGDARLAQILGAVNDLVVVTDTSGCIENLNLAAETAINKGTDEVLGQPFEEVFVLMVVDDENCEQLSNLAQRAASRNTDIVLRDPVRLELPQGPCNVRVSATVLCSSEGQVNGVVVAMTEIEQPADVDARAAQTEPAEDSDDRTACDRLLRRLQEQARILPRRHALIYADVDDLRTINAMAGMEAGNAALERVWRLLGARLDKPETAFRLGADRFAIVLENCDEERALQFASTLRQAVAATPLLWEKRDFSLSVSLGVAMFDGEGSAFDVIKRAEDACHAAKTAGPGQVRLFEASMQRGDAIDESLWLKRIREGLDLDRFRLTTQWMQPLTGQGDAFEILLALEDEEGFWTSASQFMPIVDRNHLGPELDRWVVEHTLETLARRPDRDRMSFCSINLSTHTLESPDMLDLIVAGLQAHPEVAASMLAFELREEAVTERPAGAIRFCETLRQLGCKIALDQFVGRRGNDLALLRSLPLDYVKISARQFRNLTADPVERLVAESVLRLARTLELRTIVTGIEYADELTGWNALGADYVQGFLIARPTPVIFSSPNR